VLPGRSLSERRAAERRASERRASERRASARTWLFLALFAGAVALLLVLIGVLSSDVFEVPGEVAGSDPSTSTQQPAPPEDAPGAVVGDDVVQRCAATDLVEATVRMQPEERGANGTRTLGTVTLSTTSTEPLQVWILVDEGEHSDNGWEREGWQPAGPPLSSGTPIEQRLSQTVYDDGDSTWRIINAVAAWRTGAVCAELPTEAQLDAIARPL
jgi:hypothetical protein